MDQSQFGRRVREILGAAAVRAQEPLAAHTTLRIGGPADWFVVVDTVGQLREVLSLARDCGTAVTILGGGSNVLVSDAGIRGAVVHLRLTSVSQPSPTRVRAEAGVTMNGLVRWMVGRGLAGLETWAGTPGTVGGAIYGNAHYAGRNIGETVAEVLVTDRGGTLSTLDRGTMEFAYDTSRLQRTGEILIWAEFEVAAAETSQLRNRARASLAHRKRTQPLAMPSAGCVFQNPDPVRDRLPPGVPASAGALIDWAGLKGRRIGGASISAVHANFFVNDGTATARDFRALVEAARDAVRDKCGVILRDEIVLLGTFDHGKTAD